MEEVSLKSLNYRIMVCNFATYGREYVIFSANKVLLIKCLICHSSVTTLYPVIILFSFQSIIEEACFCLFLVPEKCGKEYKLRL